MPLVKYQDGNTLVPAFISHLGAGSGDCLQSTELLCGSVPLSLEVKKGVLSPHSIIPCCRKEI